MTGKSSAERTFRIAARPGSPHAPGMTDRKPYASPKVAPLGPERLSEILKRKGFLGDGPGQFRVLSATCESCGLSQHLCIPSHEKRAQCIQCKAVLP
jgi:hypothetical protein